MVTIVIYCTQCISIVLYCDLNKVLLYSIPCNPNSNQWSTTFKKIRVQDKDGELLSEP